MKLGAAVMVGCALWLTAAHGQAQAGPEKTFADAVAALERGAVDDAIDRLESLADSGFSHPDASFNRAVAYVERARSENARPGDLGRAVAALEETLLARPGDAEAEQALERVRGEIARRRAREGAEPVVAKTSLGRAVVGLLPEAVWAGAAALGSFLASVGLALRWLSESHRRRVAASTAASIGGALLVLCGGLAFTARHFRVASRPAVVVAENARLLDQAGKPLVQKGGEPEHVSMPEGASLFVHERSGELVRIEWGTTVAWVQAAQVRPIGGTP